MEKANEAVAEEAEDFAKKEFYTDIKKAPVRRLFYFQKDFFNFPVYN